jgi:hypothetical protein
VDSVVTHRRSGGRYIEADLSVGFAMFNEKYTSRVELLRNEKIIARAKDTVLFTRLVNEWKFERGPDDKSTWLSFHVDFEFKLRQALRQKDLRNSPDKNSFKIPGSLEVRHRSSTAGTTFCQNPIEARVKVNFVQSSQIKLTFLFCFLFFRVIRKLFIL